MMKINASLGYREKQNSLSIRINANKRFSNFCLHDWLDEHLSFNPGDIILDIGCGNGNCLPCYSRKLGDRGIIVGIDQSKELLAYAMQCQVITPTVFLKWDMNSQFPFIEGNFNHVVSIFAIYYADDTNAIIKEIERILKPSGEIFLIGPTSNNARELYEFNNQIFHFRGEKEKTVKRANRIEKEFYPAVTNIFGNVSVNKIPSKLIFPNKMELIKYYMATLLFKESVKKSGFEPSVNRLLSFNNPLEIRKETIVLWGRKNA